MGRTAKALLHSLQIITIETDLYDPSLDYEGALAKGERDIARDLWNYLWVYYFVDKEGRLVYAYEGVGIKPDKIINAIANDLHPSVEEVFDVVEIIDEDTGKLLETLHNVDLIGILEGIKAVMDR